MGKVLYPNGKPCRCGCGRPAERNIGPTGKNRGWLGYAKGHQPPRALCDPAIRAKTHIARYNRIPVGTRRKKSGGAVGLEYWEVKVPNRRRWMLQHRYKMELKLGRRLRRNEVVHHKDGNGLNNRYDNLEVMLKGDHVRLHAKDNKPACSCVCPTCGIKLVHWGKGSRKKRLGLS